MKAAAPKLASLLLSFAVFTLVALTLHEWGHLQVARMLGGEGHIAYPAWMRGEFRFTIDSVPLWPAYWGGLVAPLLLLPLWAWARWTPTTWDIGHEAALAAVILAWTGYGIYEGVTAAQMNSTVITVIEGVGTAIGLTLYIRPLIAWVQPATTTTAVTALE